MVAILAALMVVLMVVFDGWDIFLIGTETL